MQFHGLKVYIAGPLTGSGDVESNTDLACKVAQRLLAIGLVPFVPHVNYRWTKACGEGAGLAWDFLWLDQCDVLLRLPGESPGSDAEEMRAHARGMYVVHLDRDYRTVGHLPGAIWRAICDLLPEAA